MKNKSTSIVVGRQPQLFRTIQQLILRAHLDHFASHSPFALVGKIQSILDLLLQITRVYSRAFYQNFSFNKPLGALSFS